MAVPTQDFIDIEEIKNDIVILKDGSAAVVIEVTAINFGLFSEREQEATIFAYAQMLNSLTFSIQIVLVSKRKDITQYVDKIDEYLTKTSNEKLKTQIVKYRDFIKSVVKQGNVLDKKFFVIIPFSSLELGVGTALSNFKGRPKIKDSIDKIIERATNNLNPKKDHIVRMLARIGLRAKQLSSQELLQLFHDLYNPNSPGGTIISFPQ